MTSDRDASDAPLEFPVDAEKERQRLIEDAKERGIDPDEALRLAEQIAAPTPDAEEYRFVDRRIAAGYTLEDAEAIAAGDTPPSNTSPADTPSSDSDE